MSAAGTPKASEAAIAAVQQALDLDAYKLAVHRHFDEPFASDLIEKTREILRLGTAATACHSQCILGPERDHPGYLEYRCIDENVHALPFPGEEELR